MSLSPAAVVTLGNLAYESHAAQVTATLTALPGVDTFTAFLPPAARVDAAPGDDAKLELDGGEGPETVLTGKLRSIARGLRGTRVVVSDGGAELADFRPAATYEKQAAKEVVRALASDASVDIGSLDLDLPLAAYVAHQRRTAAEHVADLARLAGATAAFDAEGRLRVAPRPGRPDIALRYGREFLDYEVRQRPGLQARLVAAGAGPAGSAEAPNALRPSLKPLPGGVPPPGPDAVWTAAPVLRTPKAALVASQAAEDEAAAAATSVRATCFLLPKLRPGTALEVQELPDGLPAGPWLLTRVVHRLTPAGGGTTHFEGISAGAGGATGLLASALAAAGGLL